jgi:hypothetical protein
MGEGGPLPAAGWITAKDRTALTCRAVTLSNENALGRSGHVHTPPPAAYEPRRAVHGSGRRLPWSHWTYARRSAREPAQVLAYPSPARGRRFLQVEPPSGEWSGQAGWCASRD